jgi:hypothetical protein
MYPYVNKYINVYIYEWENIRIICFHIHNINEKTFELFVLIYIYIYILLHIHKYIHINICKLHKYTHTCIHTHNYIYIYTYNCMIFVHEICEYENTRAHRGIIYSFILFVFTYIHVLFHIQKIYIHIHKHINVSI